MGMDKHGCFMEMYVYYYWNHSQHRAWRLDMFQKSQMFLKSLIVSIRHMKRETPGSHYFSFFAPSNLQTQTCLHFCTQSSSSSEHAAPPRPTSSKKVQAQNIFFFNPCISKNEFSTHFAVMHPNETLCSSINKWAVLDQNKESRPDCVSVRLERSMNREERKQMWEKERY